MKTQLSIICALAVTSLAYAGTPTVTGISFSGNTATHSYTGSFSPATGGSMSWNAPSSYSTDSGPIVGNPGSGNPVSTPAYWFGRYMSTDVNWFVSNWFGGSPGPTFSLLGSSRYPINGTITVHYVPSAGETLATNNVQAQVKCIEGHNFTTGGYVRQFYSSAGAVTGGSMASGPISDSSNLGFFPSSFNISTSASFGNIPQSITTLSSYVPYWQNQGVDTVWLSPSTCVLNANGTYDLTFDTSLVAGWLQVNQFNFTASGTGMNANYTINTQEAFGITGLKTPASGGAVFAVSNPN